MRSDANLPLLSRRNDGSVRRAISPAGTGAAQADATSGGLG